MPSYFTQYWTNGQWDFSASPEWDFSASPEEWPFPLAARKVNKPRMPTIDHTAGNMFSKAGVKVGDVIFIVTVKMGKLLLGGKIVVGNLCGQREAERILQKSEDSWPIYQAKDHIIAAGRPDQFRPKNLVPDGIVARFLFEGPDGSKFLAFDEPGYLNQQTLRGVRRLTAASAKLLESRL